MFQYFYLIMQAMPIRVSKSSLSLFNFHLSLAVYRVSPSYLTSGLTNMVYNFKSVGVHR
jgi:hypothetical protein